MTVLFILLHMSATCGIMVNNLIQDTASGKKFLIISQNPKIIVCQKIRCAKIPKYKVETQKKRASTNQEEQSTSQKQSKSQSPKKTETYHREIEEDCGEQNR